ncbi:MAG: hypothetical protein ABSH03_00340 [Candidatus Lustribacter sp.]|jgi:hypothetical protein
MKRPLLALVACAMLAACARGGSSAPAPATPAAGGRVGYVRMDDLVKKHPLFGQLAQYDANIQALSLGGLVPHVLAEGPQLKAEEARLQAQLSAAAKRTSALLAAKSKEYQERENAAIAAALRGAAATGGPSVAAIQSQMEGTARSQAAGAGAQAQRDLDAYRKQLEAQDGAQITAAEHTLEARADRTYRAKIDELNAKESSLSLLLANADAAERLSLRTRLSSLALDDAARADANNQLAALDRKESDQVAALHNQDAQTLSALQTQLRAQVQRDMNAQVGQIRQRSIARYRERSDQLRTEFAPSNGPLIATSPNGPPTVNPNLPPALRRRIGQLHADYTQAFQADAKQTIADFNKTRSDLQQRYALLTGTDAAATQSAQLEIQSLEKKRQDLYMEMVAQINREVKTIAQQRGVSTVVSTVAPAGGVDLTGDAMKDIETLHE